MQTKKEVEHINRESYLKQQKITNNKKINIHNQIQSTHQNEIHKRVLTMNWEIIESDERLHSLFPKKQ